MELSRIKKGKILKPFKPTDYYYTSLCKDGVMTQLRLHRVVAQAFLPNPDNLPCVNHKDGNKLNNNVNNLEWCTYSENVIHGYKNGLYPQEKPVECLVNGNVIKQYNSAREAQEIDGFDSQNIAKCCKGARKTHKGYEWRYIQDIEIINKLKTKRL